MTLAFHMCYPDFISLRCQPGNPTSHFEASSRTREKSHSNFTHNHIHNMHTEYHSHGSCCTTTRSWPLYNPAQAVTGGQAWGRLCLRLPRPSTIRQEAAQGLVDHLKFQDVFPNPEYLALRHADSARHLAPLYATKLPSRRTCSS